MKRIQGDLPDPPALFRTSQFQCPAQKWRQAKRLRRSWPLLDLWTEQAFGARLLRAEHTKPVAVGGMIA